MEESNDRTNKENIVSKPNHFKGKNNNNKYFFREFYGPQQKSKAMQGQESPMFCVWETSGITLGSVGTERTKKGLQ